MHTERLKIIHIRRKDNPEVVDERASDNSYKYTGVNKDTLFVENIIEENILEI